MPDILVKQVDRGLNARAVDGTELKRGNAADGSQNVLYDSGTAKTPHGFGQVESGSLPLDSGKAVLGLGIFSELDKTQHFMAVTEDKIFDRNYVTSAWDDVTQSGQAFGAGQNDPVSMAAVLHTDNIPIDAGSRAWYHHLVVSNGGLTPVQRWAGKFEADFADLVGAGGYHDTSSGRTKHFARQVGAFFNRLLLINPKEADANNNLVDNNQRIRYPQAGKLEIWTGKGSGKLDLLDTGGYNVWGALLGTQWIQYQNNSIWSLTHVGGRRVFEPNIEFPDLGLLAPHLIYSKKNVHYFVGNDKNIYAYHGGSDIEKIGNKIHKYLERDLDPAYARRSWMCMEANNSRLWLYIVPNGKTEVTEAYGIDMVSGSWMKREFTHKWATGGITAVALVGASSYTEGLTYAESLAAATTYADYASGGADPDLAGTLYNEMLTRTLTSERQVIGDSNGYVYQFDSALSQDDTVNIPSTHITEIYDLGRPRKNKIWPAFFVTAKGTGIIISYRIGNFETTGTGWTAFAEQVLTSEYVDYEFTVHDTSKKIQFRFTNADGDDFQYSNYGLVEPILMNEA